MNHLLTRGFHLILFSWLLISMAGYAGYVNFISTLKPANEEHINVYFAAEMIRQLKLTKDEAVLVVLPDSLPYESRWFYHYRIRYKFYPQKVDFAENWSGKLERVSYDYRNYKGKLPVTIDPSNMLPLILSNYRYVITIAGAKLNLPNFTLLTDAEDVKGAVYQRAY